MPVTDSIAWHVVPFLLVVTRLGGLFLFAPMLANRSIPRRARAMLALGLGAAVYVSVPNASQSPPEVSAIMLVPLVLGEMLIGAAMGLVASIPIMALDVAGYLIGHQMGLGLARVYNPEADVDTDLIGQMLMYLGIAAFAAMGGLEALFLAVAYSFDRVPLGAFAASSVPLDPLLGVLGSGYELALRVAAPALGIIVILLVAMGFIMKTMPQINVLSVGFSVKIFFGLLILTASLTAIHEVAGDEVARVLHLIVEWGRTM